MTDNRNPTLLIAGSFAISGLASLGLLVTYVVGGQPQVEGTLIAVSLGGLAVGLILWAHASDAHRPFRRGAGASPIQRRGAFISVRRAGPQPGRDPEENLPRPDLGGGAGDLGSSCALPGAFVGHQARPNVVPHPLDAGARVVTGAGEAITSTTLEVGSVLTVFPEGHTKAADSQTVLLRVDPAAFSPLPGRETWSPDGYFAYSKVCTHAGCPVALYQAEAQRAVLPLPPICIRRVRRCASCRRPRGPGLCRNFRWRWTLTVSLPRNGTSPSRWGPDSGMTRRGPAPSR